MVLEKPFPNCKNSTKNITNAHVHFSTNNSSANKPLQCVVGDEKCFYTCNNTIFYVFLSSRYIIAVCLHISTSAKIKLHLKNLKPIKNSLQITEIYFLKK